MFLEADVFVLDILVFRSIVAAAAIFYIYKCTESYKRYCLFLLILCLALIVIGIDSYVCRQRCSKQGWTTHSGLFKVLHPNLKKKCAFDEFKELDSLDEPPFPSLPSIQYDKPNILKPSSTEVMTVTPWLAPVVWTGTFNRDILMREFERTNNTIGLTVFALGAYWKLLKGFLESADKFFMIGHKVIYYVYTDQPEKVQCISIHKDRKCNLYKTSSYDSRERIFMQRMEILHQDIKRKLIDVQYLVCSDVDLVFYSDVGVEILGDLVATLHPWFYRASRDIFTYERRPSSQAYIPKEEGDFYYQANFFAGRVKEIYRLTKYCDKTIKIDDSNGIVAVFHDESHFNKYLLYHKPTKILSPEYIWNWGVHRTSEIKTIRILHGQKDI